MTCAVFQKEMIAFLLLFVYEKWLLEVVRVGHIVKNAGNNTLFIRRLKKCILFCKYRFLAVKTAFG